MHAPAGSCWLQLPRITGNAGPLRTPHGFFLFCYLCFVRPNVVLGNCRDVSNIIMPLMQMFVCFFCRKRAPYIAYLTRCRQGLQTSQAHLERLLQRVLRDKEVANRYFTTVCVRILLEHMEAKMLDFIKGILIINLRVIKNLLKALSFWFKRESWLHWRAFSTHTWQFPVFFPKLFSYCNGVHQFWKWQKSNCSKHSVVFLL